MKSAAAVLALAATASAFAPAPVRTLGTALNSDAAVEADAAPVEAVAAEPAEEVPAPYNVFEEYIGAQDYKGEKFEFDPLGLAATYPPLVPFFREAETRHGRTAMLAVLGFVTTDFVRLPGVDAYSFENVPKTIDAHNILLEGPMHQLLLWIALFDFVITIPAVQATMNGERDAGDFGIPYIKSIKDEETRERYQMNELLHGRLAMIAVGGIATQSVITGHGFPYI